MEDKIDCHECKGEESMIKVKEWEEKPGCTMTEYVCEECDARIIH